MNPASDRVPSFPLPVEVPLKRACGISSPSPPACATFITTITAATITAGVSYAVCRGWMLIKRHWINKNCSGPVFSKLRRRAHTCLLHDYHHEKGARHWPGAKSTLPITHELENNGQAPDSGGPRWPSAYYHLVGLSVLSLCCTVITGDANSARS